MLLVGVFNTLYKNINLCLITSEISLWRPSIDSAISERVREGKACIYFILLMLLMSLAIRLFQISNPYKAVGTTIFEYRLI